MDPLSVAASIASLLDLAQGLIKYTYHVKKAPEEVKDLKQTVDGLLPVLYTVEERAEEAEDDMSHPWYRGLRRLDPKKHPNGPVARLKTCMEEIAQELMPDKDWKKNTQPFLWHWSRDKLKSKLREIDSCCIAISQVLDKDQFDISRKIQEQGKETNENVKQVQLQGEDTNVAVKQMQELMKSMETRNEKQNEEDERQMRNKIAEWLSPFRFLARQQELFEGSYPTGKWLLSSEEFKSWYRGRPWQLQLWGDAGAGKTVLSSIIAHHLQEFIGTSDMPIICLYLESKDRKLHTPQALLGSLLKQIIQLKHSNFVSPRLRKMYNDATERAPSARAVHECLVEEISNFERVYLVVDALDECTEKTRIWLLEEMPLLQPDKLSIIVTSRNFEKPETEHVWCNNCKKSPLRIFFSCGSCKVDICQECREKGIGCDDATHEPLNEPYSRVVVNVRTPDSELVEYVEDQMMKEVGGADRRDVRLRLNPSTTAFGRRLVRTPSLLEDISRLVVENAEGNFILAKLYLDSLKDQRNEEDIRLQMGNFPKSVSLLYEKSMQKIKDQENQTERETALKIFSVLSCTRETLTFTDLQILVALRPGDVDYHKGREVYREEIVDWTKGLITIDGEADEESVRLFHATFDSYLNDTGEQWFGNAHAGMAKACLTYLNFDPLTQPLGRLDAYEEIRAKYPFVAYASQYWGDHVRKAAADEGIQKLAAGYVSEPRRVTACLQAAWSSSKHGAFDMDFPRYAHGLHICAWFGLSNVIVAMDNAAMDVDVVEGNYRQTPLMFAARRGHVDVVKQLLSLGADVNKIDKRGRTVMVEAIEHGREAIVDILLQQDDLRINQSTKSKGAPERTALMVAVSLPQENIVEKLLAHPELQVNKQNPQGVAALMFAAQGGKAETVKNLLERHDIKVRLEDKTRGWTALTSAAVSGQIEVLSILLEHQNGALQNDSKIIGNALFRGVEYGHFEIVDALLQHDAGLAYKEDGRGILHVCCASKNSDDLMLFLVADRVPDVNIQEDNFGFTPLHEACRAGNLKTLNALIELGADTTIRNKLGRIPLETAWLNGEAEAVDLLISKDPDFSARQAHDLTEAQLPAWSLARTGRIKALADAMGTKRLNLTEPEPISGDTALHFAVRKDGKVPSADLDEILDMLLSTGEITPDVRNHYGRVPLHFAAFWGNIEAVETLIKKQATVDAQDQWDATPLRIACNREHLEVACCLVEAGARPDVEGIDVQDLFFDTIKLGRARAAEKLLMQGADVMEKDEEGRTALEIAKDADDAEMLQALRSSSTFFSSVGNSTYTSSSSPSFDLPQRQRVPFPKPADVE